MSDGGADEEEGLRDGVRDFALANHLLALLVYLPS